jgi:hypothetical protein
MTYARTTGRLQTSRSCELENRLARAGFEVEAVQGTFPGGKVSGPEPDGSLALRGLVRWKL